MARRDERALRAFSATNPQVPCSLKNDLDRRRRYGTYMTDGGFHRESTEPSRAQRLIQRRPNHRNDQMPTKSTTHANEEGGVQTPARVRDRIGEFHEDSIKPAVIACFTVRDRQNPETHPCP